MVFEDGAVVVEDGEVALGIDVEVVGGARVLVVVDDCGEEEGKDLNVSQPVFDPSLRYEPMRCLQDVSGVEVVVVGVAIPVVAHLQVPQQGLQQAWGDLVLVAAPVLVQQVVTHELQRGAMASFGELEQTKVPIVHMLQKKHCIVEKLSKLNGAEDVSVETCNRCSTASGTAIICDFDILR